jgi:hypothetical protein
MGIASRHQCRAGWRAHRLSIILLEPRTRLRELVDIGRLDIRSVKPDVFPPEVVREDVDDVRPCESVLSLRRSYPSQTNAESRQCGDDGVQPAFANPDPLANDDEFPPRRERDSEVSLALRVAANVERCLCANTRPRGRFRRARGPRKKFRRLRIWLIFCGVCSCNSS